MSNKDSHVLSTESHAGSELPGRLIVVSGASGSGKSTLLSLALNDPRVKARRSISATTRPPRPGEVEGRDYFFMARSEFEAGVAQSAFLEWAEVHGNLYGTPREAVERQLALGDCVILEIDVQGAFQVRARLTSTVLIFIRPPDFETLEARLRQRSTEDASTLALRLENARRETEQASLYDHQLLNEDLDRAAEDLVRLFDSLGCGGSEDDARRT